MIDLKIISYLLKFRTKACIIFNLIFLKFTAQKKHSKNSNNKNYYAIQQLYEYSKL